MRYRLDDLGWFDFEALVQSILKAELGLGVESWGGHSDRGRDAYSLGPLGFPDRNSSNPGPFVFQMKFVSNANAAGARPFGLLRQAVKAEAERIREKIRTGRWDEPKHYLLITNVTLTGGMRDGVQELLSHVGEASVTAHGGGDLCNILDSHPNLRRAFPELLGLRDLDALLERAVNHTVIERSQFALAEARQLAPVFIATEAYQRALTVLSSHGFVVLDGPPEMGKTAIARIISLLKLCEGWEAIDCRGPEDLFASFRRQTRQLFIADDAFGRTEFNVTRARDWERDLSRILRAVDPSHWLVLTSRKHILARALQELDLTGAARNFPEPAELTVSADQLSVQEKARILYRHAKVASLTEELKVIVQHRALQIVQSPYFTPERIRRLISDRLPDLGTAQASMEMPTLHSVVTEIMRDPTQSMRLSYRALPEEHQWLLISLLEANGPSSPGYLQSRFEALQSDVSQARFAELVDDLTGTFIKLTTTIESLRTRLSEAMVDGATLPGRPRTVHSSEVMGELIDWIHPSYRDLVIEELELHVERQAQFLEHASAHGIALALSHTGGATGERTFPLVTVAESWCILESRSVSLARAENDGGLAELLDSGASALKTALEIPQVHSNVRRILIQVCTEVASRWAVADRAVSAQALYAFGRAMRTLDADAPSSPDFFRMWMAAAADMGSFLDERGIEDPSCGVTRVENWVGLVELIQQSDPALLLGEPFAHDVVHLSERLTAAIASEFNVDPSQDYPEGPPDDLSSHYEGLCDALGDGTWIPAELGVTAEELGGQLVGMADEYRSWEEPYGDEDDGYTRSQTSQFSVSDMFADL